MKNKKQLLLLTMVIAIVSTIIMFNANKETNPTSRIADIAFTQIEALASDESGTNVGTCYTDHYSWESTQHRHCDSRTSSSTIYPCPSAWCSGAGMNAANCTK